MINAIYRFAQYCSVLKGAPNTILLQLELFLLYDYDKNCLRKCYKICTSFWAHVFHSLLIHIKNLITTKYSTIVTK